MKVLAPLNNADMIDKLCAAGADEFYFGFYDEYAEKGRANEINSMSGYGRRANSFTLTKALELSRHLNIIGKKPYLVVNSRTYSEEGYENLKRVFYTASLYGKPTVILADPIAMLLAKEFGLDFCVSGMGATYNTSAVDFFARIGARRIIAPRDLSVAEIDALAKHDESVEIEVFAIRNGCVLSDANCLGLHLHEHGGVCLSCRQAVTNLGHVGATRNLKNRLNIYNNSLWRLACGACAFWHFKQIGVSSLKVVGRLDKPDLVLRDTEFVASIRDSAQSCHSQAEFLASMPKPADYEERCNGFNCYYPDCATWKCI